MADCNIERTLKKTKDKIPYYYSLSLDDFTELLKEVSKDPIEGVIKAYKYGFCKGTRAKARGKVPTL